MSQTIDKLKDKVEHVLHKDKAHHNRVDTAHHTTAANGPHSSSLLNKADPRVDSDRDGSRNMGLASHGPGADRATNTTGGMTSGVTGAAHQVTGDAHGAYGNTAGPHGSNLMNKADPRVDSDRDGSRNMGLASHGPGAVNAGGGITGAHAHTTAGPHGSDTLNKVDPRVDSDRDGSANMGLASHGPGATHTGGGIVGATGTHNTAGPHQTDVLNKADPRVDSDRDGSTNMGLASHGPGATHTGGGMVGARGTHNTAGPHHTDVLNKADPRVDSDRDGSANMGLASHGPGATRTGGGVNGPHVARNTAGPHDSNLLNKVDPRVDSDRDGSHAMPGTY